VLGESKAFSSFSVNDLDRARRFYEGTLGLRVSVTAEMGPVMTLHLGGGAEVMVYAKDDHVPATFTVLNFPVPDLEATVDRLAAEGVTFERYEQYGPDEKGIHTGDEGPAIAWFRDPDGNFISLMQE
jgi:predicted enzyme related to lactoylglutathione lyase